MADDDQDDATLFGEALREVDPSITCYLAADGHEMLNKLRTTGFALPDVIFLDLNLPVMDGWQCLRELKHDTILQRIPVIIYSTSSATRDKQMAAHLGATYFYSKPDNYNDLKRFLRNVARYVNGELPSLTSD